MLTAWRGHVVSCWRSACVRLGRLVLQAAEYFDAAEPSYLNAQTLNREDVRWPYYLANLYKSRGETDKAEAAFTRALELQPNDLATLIWLARLNLDQGKTGEAEALRGALLQAYARSTSVWTEHHYHRQKEQGAAPLSELALKAWIASLSTSRRFHGRVGRHGFELCSDLSSEPNRVWNVNCAPFSIRTASRW